MDHITFIVQLMEYDYQKIQFNADFKVFIFYNDQMMEFLNMLTKMDPLHQIK